MQCTGGAKTLYCQVSGITQNSEDLMSTYGKGQTVDVFVIMFARFVAVMNPVVESPGLARVREGDQLDPLRFAEGKGCRITMSQVAAEEQCETERFNRETLEDEAYVLTLHYGHTDQIRIAAHTSFLGAGRERRKGY